MFAPSGNPGRDRLLAIGLICSCCVMFSLLDASAKWLGQSLHPMQAVWARYITSVIFVFVLINPWSHPGVLRTARPTLQVARSILLFLSTVFNFLALQHLQLAEAISIVFATPLLVALLAGPMLGEWVGPRRLIAIAVGFLGVLIVLRPGLGGLHPAAIFSVCGVVCYVFYSLWTRRLAAYDSSETTMVYSGLAGVVLATPWLPFIWKAPDTALSWVLLLLTGVFGGFGHWLLICAHRLAPAGILSPFIYTQLIWMLILGWLIFDQWPDRWTLTGGLIVVGSGLYLLWREREARRAAVPAP